MTYYLLIAIIGNIYYDIISFRFKHIKECIAEIKLLFECGAAFIRINRFRDFAVRVQILTYFILGIFIHGLIIRTIILYLI